MSTFPQFTIHLDWQHGSASLGWNICSDTCEENNLLVAFIASTVRGSKRIVMTQNSQTVKKVRPMQKKDSMKKVVKLKVAAQKWLR